MTQKQGFHRSPCFYVVVKFDNENDNNRELPLRLGNIPVGAVDGIFAGVIIPARTFADAAPLSFRAFIFDRGQPATVIERVVPDRGHAVGNGDRGQPATVLERIVPYTGHTTANGDRGQPATGVERTPTYRVHAAGDGD